MSDFENNKIFAALLCALIMIWLTSFIANKVFSVKPLKQDAVAIDGAPVTLADAGPAKPELPDPIMAMLASADIERGAKISKACAACHSFNQGGPVKQGPNLYNILGADKGVQGGFKYSDALASFDGKWDYNALNFFFWKPKKYIPGTKMNFAGLKKAKDRASLIMWLREQGSQSYPLPSEGDIQAEEARFNPEPEETEEATETENAETEGAAEDAKQDSPSDEDGQAKKPNAEKSETDAEKEPAEE